MRDVFKSKFKVRKLCVSICAEPVFVNCGGGTFLCRQIIIARERERERNKARGDSQLHVRFLIVSSSSSCVMMNDHANYLNPD